MMADQYFAYDSSITAPLSRVPIWPYTLQYRYPAASGNEEIIFLRMPHKCHGNSGNCPSRSHPIWEMPINELDRRDDPDFDENLTGCHLVSSCSNIYHKDQFRYFMAHGGSLTLSQDHEICMIIKKSIAKRTCPQATAEPQL